VIEGMKASEKAAVRTERNTAAIQGLLSSSPSSEAAVAHAMDRVLGMVRDSLRTVPCVTHAMRYNHPSSVAILSAPSVASPCHPVNPHCRIAHCIMLSL
jgi:hypothetical protein